MDGNRKAQCTQGRRRRFCCCHQLDFPVWIWWGGCKRNREYRYAQMDLCCSLVAPPSCSFWPPHKFVTKSTVGILLLPGVAADGNVRLASLGLYRTHEWLGQPTVYFQCHGEPKVYLPDVIQKDFVYDFVGQESWQPLTFLVGAKCKRCGFYEEDKLKYDDRFDEWELCPTEFTLEPDGRYIHFNKDEFNATFVCPGCSNPQQWMYESEDGDQYDPPLVKHKSYFLLIVLVLAAAILIVAAVAFLAYGYWQHKQHQAHQAWFMELFEDDESLQANLGLKEDL